MHCANSHYEDFSAFKVYQCLAHAHLTFFCPREHPLALHSTCMGISPASVCVWVVMYIHCMHLHMSFHL